MSNRQWVLLALLALAGGVLPAQEFSPGYVDARPVLEAAAEAIGADNLKCVTISWHGYAGMVGQHVRRQTKLDTSAPLRRDTSERMAA